MGKRTAQPIVVAGEQCSVQKHDSMGCAFVSFSSEEVRDQLLWILGLRASDNGMPMLWIGGHRVLLQKRADKDTKLLYPCDMFIAWGRQAELESPLAGQQIADAFDALVIEAYSLGSYKENAENVYNEAPKAESLPACRFAGAGVKPQKIQPPPGLGLEYESPQWSAHARSIAFSAASGVSRYAPTQKFCKVDSMRGKGCPLSFSPVLA
eukprot:TRINITY_DN6047_c0_g3_i1.p1 TRINITY_DN6047_c0_g3~~TRINITY_DN6047_c0_g3_i1.p1  ORF type:complete len:227 (-),score=43.47 TRINITY_DN6047_c0_g3_i1:66-692(-)